MWPFRVVFLVHFSSAWFKWKTSSKGLKAYGLTLQNHPLKDDRLTKKAWWKQKKPTSMIIYI